MAKRPFTTSPYTWGYSLFCTSIPVLIFPALAALVIFGMLSQDNSVTGHAALALEAVR